MKTYPESRRQDPYQRELRKDEVLMRKIALVVAFISVFVFFIKLLFL